MQIEEKFGIAKDFQFAFMDSFSQAGTVNLNDQVQQDYWIQETNKVHYMLYYVKFQCIYQTATVGFTI